MESTRHQIENKLKHVKPGKIIFPTDFRGLGSEAAIKMSLSRLVKDGKLERIAHGIYLKAKKHPQFGKLQPSLEQIAEAIADRERIRIRPAGAYALNKLGLSTQVPTKLVYITDGQSRQIQIGKGGIKFKTTVPKKFGMTGTISSLLFLALEEIGNRRIDSNLKIQIEQLLQKEDPGKLKHDLKLAPAWINDLVVSLNLNSSRTP